MPLGHRGEVFIPEPAGFYFLLKDPLGTDVLCLVEQEALLAAAKECGIEHSDMRSVFQELRPAIEACASDLYDAAGVESDGAVDGVPERLALLVARRVEAGRLAVQDRLVARVFERGQERLLLAEAEVRQATVASHAASLR
jgi:hypothetical protein